MDTTRLEAVVWHALKMISNLARCLGGEEQGALCHILVEGLLVMPQEGSCRTQRGVKVLKLPSSRIRIKMVKNNPSKLGSVSLLS